MSLAPMHLPVVAFGGADVTGRVRTELGRLSDSGAIRVLALAAVGLA